MRQQIGSRQYHPQQYASLKSSVTVLLRSRGNGGTKVIMMTSCEPRPLCSRPASDTCSGIRGLPVFRPELVTIEALNPPWPAFRRILPGLLTTIDGHVKHPIAVGHCLTSPGSGPVRLKHAVAIAQVADLHPEMMVTALQIEVCVRLLGHGIPRHVPAHELAVAVALLEWTLTEDREGDVARVQVRQLERVAGEERTAFALVCSREAGVPHVI